MVNPPYLHVLFPGIRVLFLNLLPKAVYILTHDSPWELLRLFLNLLRFNSLQELKLLLPFYTSDKQFYGHSNLRKNNIIQSRLKNFKNQDSKNIQSGGQRQKGLISPA
jgi:hypothetical protein